MNSGPIVNERDTAMAENRARILPRLLFKFFVYIIIPKPDFTHAAGIQLIPREIGIKRLLQMTLSLHHEIMCQVPRSNS